MLDIQLASHSLSEPRSEPFESPASITRSKVDNMSCDLMNCPLSNFNEPGRTVVMSSLLLQHQPYSVPVILPDLRRQESYLQIVDALEYLDAVANDIFNRITCRYLDK